MTTLFKATSWQLTIRGLALILFGIMALIWPNLTVTVLAILFGVYALVDGVVSVVGAILNRKTSPNWTLLLIMGLISIIAGIFAISNPGVTSLALLYIIAVWALLIGLVSILTAVRLRREIEGEWVMIAAGVLSIVFGIALIVAPDAGAAALAWLIGAYAIILGILDMLLAARARGWARAFDL